MKQALARNDRLLKEAPERNPACVSAKDFFIARKAGGFFFLKGGTDVYLPLL